MNPSSPIAAIPARREGIAGKSRPRVELGEFAEIGQKQRGPRAVLGQMLVGNDRADAHRGSASRRCGRAESSIGSMPDGGSSGGRADPPAVIAATRSANPAGMMAGIAAASGSGISGRGSRRATSTGFSPRSGYSLTPVIGALRSAMAAARGRAHLTDAHLQGAGSETADDPAFRFDLLESLPRGFAHGFRQGLVTPGSGGRIDHAPQIALVQQNILSIARHAPGEGVRQAERGRERQGGHGIGATDSCGEGRNRGAQKVDPGVALRGHTPGGLAMQTDRRGLQPRRCLDARPEPAQGAELGDGRKLIGIRRQQEGEVAPPPDRERHRSLSCARQ